MQSTLQGRILKCCGTLPGAVHTYVFSTKALTANLTNRSHCMPFGACCATVLQASAFVGRQMWCQPSSHLNVSISERPWQRIANNSLQECINMIQALHCAEITSMSLATA